MTDISIMTSTPLSREECAAWLSTHNNYLILMHANPDGDTVGAGIGLCRILHLMGKTAHCACASPIPYKLCGITDEISDLTLDALDADFVYDKVITVDVATPALLGGFEEMFGARVDLCIDHHATNTHYAKNTCVDGTLAACTELIFDIGVVLFLWDEDTHKMPAEIAAPLYAGLHTDSGSFQFGAVTPMTHRRAAVMLASGIAHTRITERLFGNKSLSEVMATRAAYDGMKLFADGKVALVSFTEEIMKRYGLCDEDIDNVVNLLRSIAGVRVAVHIKARGEDTYKLSLRCEEGFDVAAIALLFGGGGHTCAAGCTLTGDISEIEETVVSAIEKAL